MKGSGMKFSIKLAFGATAFGLAMLSAAAGVMAQGSPKVQPSSFAGKYEGTIKDETGEQKVTLDLLEDSGKFSGTFTTARGSFKILKGQVTDGSLTLETERPGGGSGTMTLRQSDKGLTATIF